MPNTPLPEDVGPKKEPVNTDPNQYSKRVLLFVLCVGVAALILGGVQLRRNLKQPFNLVATKTNVNSSPTDQTLLQLKAKDTDKDGLNDYDELYINHTSPYIADSDSDGISDGQEITNGTDPNCPQGQNCSLISANSNSNSNSNQNTNAQTNSNASQVTAAQLRQALLAAGVAQSDLDAIDDATLLKNYQDVASEQTTNTNSSTNTNSGNSNSTQNSNTNTSSGLTLQQLQNLSNSEIRTFLKLGGVSEETLNSYDDATLRSVYLQALQQTFTNSNTNS